jgi:hypothetical protein
MGVIHISTIRVNSKELQALDYVKKRTYKALKRRANNTTTEIQNYNAIKLLIDKIKGQKTLFK